MDGFAQHLESRACVRNDSVVFPTHMRSVKVCILVVDIGGTSLLPVTNRVLNWLLQSRAERKWSQEGINSIKCPNSGNGYIYIPKGIYELFWKAAVKNKTG
jgi:hypothetical protein